ncbi:hypothetical protein GCM10010197_39550 [Nocardioides luteus]|uniref:Bacterial sugar transferase domain-containing protein n=2 Tax=Nocardioides luteus TaxID=1844 RepID=A0ABQ5SX90_9ACTN|nr:hypothetical protein GCM10010197_39550 [Nocardioides luteus]GLJ68235.1 hypothetical protein GCM10017579_22710 [Nocardioides luteus]
METAVSLDIDHRRVSPKAPSPRLQASMVDGLALTILAPLLVGQELLHAIGWGVAWGLMTRIAAPKILPGAERLRATVSGVFKAFMAMCMATWLLGAAVELEQTQLVAQTIIGLITALAFRVGGYIFSSRPRNPLRVVVVEAAHDTGAIPEWTRRLSGGLMEAAAVCRAEGLSNAIASVAPDAVLVVPGPDLAGREIQRLAWTSESFGLPLLVSTRMQDVTPQRTSSMRLGSMTLLYVDEALRARLTRVVKYVWEWLAAAAAATVLLPVFIALAIVIKLDSPGPVFFRQVRVGRNGKQFRIWKFRTMVVDAESLLRTLDHRPGHVLFKLRADPRVTRVGRVLRKYSLDELPQLFNIVLGQMSLVGPRPGLPSEVAMYDRDSHRRLAVAPGLTGLWQVSGRSDLSWEDTVRLDLDYVDNWTLLRDFGIVVRTVKVVVRGSGAY